MRTLLMLCLMTTKNYGRTLCNGLEAFNSLLVAQFALCDAWLQNSRCATLGAYFTLLPRYIAYANVVPSRHEACIGPFSKAVSSTGMAQRLNTGLPRRGPRFEPRSVVDFFFLFRFFFYFERYW